MGRALWVWKWGPLVRIVSSKASGTWGAARVERKPPGPKKSKASGPKKHRGKKRRGKSIKNMGCGKDREEATETKKVKYGDQKSIGQKSIREKESRTWVRQRCPWGRQ